MRLTLVRHGETDFNVKKISQGQLNIPLNDNGIEQAKKVGLRLKDMNFDKIFVSDLKRTKETAEQIIQHHPNVPVIDEKRLREVHAGIFQGQPGENIRKALAESGLPREKFCPEQGESLTDVQNRAIDFFNELKASHNGKNILAISHGALISTFFLHLFSKSFDKFLDYIPRNTGISIINFKDSPEVEILNCTKHLD